MGEYFVPVNVTARQRINPHAEGDSLKNWFAVPSRTRWIMNQLIRSGQWLPTDDIRIVSDYGSEFRIRGDGPTIPDLYNLAHERYVEVSFSEFL